MTAQPQTFPGKRGQTPLSVVGDGGRPLMYRDAHNAVLVGLNRAAGRPDDADPYGHNLDLIDPVAAAQNAAVYLEELAGIYPNVPDLEPVDEAHIPRLNVRPCRFCDEPWGGHDEGCPNG